MSIRDISTETNQQLVNTELSKFNGTTISTELDSTLVGSMDFDTLKACICNFLEKKYPNYSDLIINPQSGFLYVKIKPLPNFDKEIITVE